ncbi:hypothetical protein HRI_004723400 [Hibiscus trionum]|uniref:CCHC-type domain-containing protein n=1 Tax=Hibiscus trionum TaxID=183268 RepID=A0A9W7MS02_HIBTR|nr:hypothetical protein HRI_004723400 [Hibiscus trionum]
MADMAEELAGLTLESGEDDLLEVDLPESEQKVDYSFCLVGIFLTTSIINFPSMRSTLANLWRPVGGISIIELGDGRFLFRFFNGVDVDRVDSGGPWNFNNHLLVHYRLKPGEDPMLVALTHLCFWVFVYDIPHGFMLEKVARSLGDFIGKFIEYDCRDASLSYKGIMRIRVLMDVRLPLKRRKKLLLSNGKHHFVRFAYEKLTLFCFICGRLGHGELFCPVRVMKGPENVECGWDLSLKVLHRRATVPASIWLRDPVDFGKQNLGDDQDGKSGKENSAPLFSPTHNFSSGGVILTPNIALHSKHPAGATIPMGGINVTGLGGINVNVLNGLSANMDVLMDPVGEDNALDPVESSKRQRVVPSVSSVSTSMDSAGTSALLSADLNGQVSRSQ